MEGDILVADVTCMPSYWEDAWNRQLSNKLSWQSRSQLRKLLDDMDAELRECWVRWGLINIFALLAQNGVEAGYRALLKNASIRTKIHILVCNYFIPGAENVDLESILLFTLWQTTQDYDPSKGKSFLNYFWMVAKNEVKKTIETATRMKHRPHNEADSLDLEYDPDDNKSWSDDLTDHSSFARDPAVIVWQRIFATTYPSMLSLSDFESDCVQLFAEGYTYWEIVEKLRSRYSFCRGPRSVTKALSRVRHKAEKYLATETPPRAKHTPMILDKAMRSLKNNGISGTHREIALLYLEGLSCNDIAKRTGRKVGTVGKTIFVLRMRGVELPRRNRVKYVGLK